MLQNSINASFFASLGVKALLYEVIASPKPGLVDSFDSGAHSDMDIFTFTGAIPKFNDYFVDCFNEGFNNYSMQAEGMIERIRHFGIITEKQMLSETGGVNTHKGLIYSFGIIFQALGRHLHGKSISAYIDINEVSNIIIKSTQNEIYLFKQCKSVTYGNSNYIKYGSYGARGEATTGFRSAIDHGLETIENSIKSSGINNSIINCLIALMCVVDDGNILGRHNLATLNRVKADANMAIELGAMSTCEGRNFINNMNINYIKNNISPGGSADLTAISLLFYFFKNIKP